MLPKRSKSIMRQVCRSVSQLSQTAAARGLNTAPFGGGASAAPLHLFNAPAVSLAANTHQQPEKLIEWCAHERVLSDLKTILPHCPNFKELKTVQTWQPTEHDMINWKSDVEKEREEKAEQVS